MFRRVKKDVLKATNNEQRPWVRNGLLDPFKLNPSVATTSFPTRSQPVTESEPNPSISSGLDSSDSVTLSGVGSSPPLNTNTSISTVYEDFVGSLRLELKTCDKLVNDQLQCTIFYKNISDQFLDIVFYSAIYRGDIEIKNMEGQTYTITEVLIDNRSFFNRISIGVNSGGIGLLTITANSPSLIKDKKLYSLEWFISNKTESINKDIIFRNISINQTE